MNTSSAPKTPRVRLSSVLGVLIFAAVVRFLFIGHESLWLDEINTILVGTTHGYPNEITPEPLSVAQWFERYLAWQPLDMGMLLAMLKQNVHMPLYYMLLNPWMGLFGMSEESLRGFSAVFSWLMLIPLYYLGKAMGRRVGIPKLEWWVLVIAAVNPFQLYYAQEARMYTLGMFLSAGAALSFWKMLYGKHLRNWSIAFALFLLPGIFTHYTFLFQLPFYGMFGLIHIFNRPERKHLSFIPIVLLVLGALWLWFPVFVAQQSGALADGDHFSAGLLGFERYIGMLGWSPLMLISGSTKPLQYFYIPVSIVLFLIFCWQMISQRFRLKTHGFLLLWVIVPLLFQSMVDYLQESHTVTIIRYTMFIAPAAYLMLAMALAQLPERFLLSKLRLALIGVMAFLAIAHVIPTTVWPQNPFHYKSKLETREIAAYISNHHNQSDMIVSNGPLAAPCTLAYYLHDLQPDMPLLYWVKNYQEQKSVPRPPARLFQQHQRVWAYFYLANRARGVYTLTDILSSHYPTLEVIGEVDNELSRYSR